MQDENTNIKLATVADVKKLQEQQIIKEIPALVDLATILKKVGKEIKAHINKINPDDVVKAEFSSIVSIFMSNINNWIKIKEVEQVSNRMDVVQGSPKKSLLLCETLGMFNRKQQK